MEVIPELLDLSGVLYEPSKNEKRIFLHWEASPFTGCNWELDILNLLLLVDLMSASVSTHCQIILLDLTDGMG